LIKEQEISGFEDGYQIYRCKRCNREYIEILSLPPLTIDFNNKEIVGYNSTATEIIIPKYYFEEAENQWYEIESIGRGAFADCTNLKKVTFADALIIDDEAFIGCGEIEFIYNKTINRVGQFPYGANINSTQILTGRGDDMDFIGFTFNGIHSYYDLKTYRTSDGDRYASKLTATQQN
jgi:hypothetical protein